MRLQVARTLSTSLGFRRQTFLTRGICPQLCWSAISTCHAFAEALNKGLLAKTGTKLLWRQVILQHTFVEDRPSSDILELTVHKAANRRLLSLAQRGLLLKYGIELIGAKLPSIDRAEDRELFKQSMKRIGLKVPLSGAGRLQRPQRQSLLRVYAWISRPAENFSVFSGLFLSESGATGTPVAALNWLSAGLV